MNPKLFIYFSKKNGKVIEDSFGKIEKKGNGKEIQIQTITSFICIYSHCVSVCVSHLKNTVLFFLSKQHHLKTLPTPITTFTHNK